MIKFLRIDHSFAYTTFNVFIWDSCGEVCIVHGVDYNDDIIITMTIDRYRLQS